MQHTHSEKAVFGGGCFWCTDAVFRNLKGVVSVEAGFAGGKSKNPTYEEVVTNNTGHIEVVKIEYTPDIISYKDLLTVFFATHDPTSVDKQGADVGIQYRSVIFYISETQKQESEQYIQTLKNNGIQIVTRVEPFTEFFPASQEHQDYYNKNTTAPYCQVVINPKLTKLQQDFKEMLKRNSERCCG